MEYIYVCPKCGATYGCSTNTGKICSECNVETVFTGETGEKWYTKTQSARDNMKKQIINGAFVPPPLPTEEVEKTSEVFCRHCGEKILSKALICPHCGCPTDRPNEEDVPSTGLNVLSFFFPIVGLILYCVFYTRTPKRAAAVGKWALISVGVSVALWLILAISGVSIFSML